MISNLVRLKKMMVDKPYLYEEEEHAVLKLAEDAIEFILVLSGKMPGDWMEGYPQLAKQFLEEHK